MWSLRDAALGEQRLERRAVDEVALDRVLQVGLPVEPDGAADVPLLVRRRCPRRPRRTRRTGRRGAPRPSRRRPGRQCGSCAASSASGERAVTASARDGSSRRPTRYISQPRQNAERRVQERRRQRQADRDQPDGGRLERERQRADKSEGEADPLGEARRGGRLELGWAARGAGERRRRNRTPYGLRCSPAKAPIAKTTVCAASSQTLPVSSTTARTTVVRAAAKRGPRGSITVISEGVWGSRRAGALAALRWGGTRPEGRRTGRFGQRPVSPDNTGSRRRGRDRQRVAG